MAGSSILLFAACLLSPRPYARAAEPYKTCSTVANCTSPSAPYCQTIFADFRGTNTSIKVIKGMGEQGNGMMIKGMGEEGNERNQGRTRGTRELRFPHCVWHERIQGEDQENERIKGMRGSRE